MQESAYLSAADSCADGKQTFIFRTTGRKLQAEIAKLGAGEALAPQNIKAVH